ncbi:pyridoxamine 5'-phosphate oxidase family protein [Streptomyces sp. NBC_00019]|uniref:pyridoxamine 5'-phosphate oxidase family protein n=1 Tax=Streptomyces sp. NBC_00019 TaxID=2975623 RepID=UPI00324CD684
MSTPSSDLRMVEVSGAEALWLLESSALGRLVYVQRETALVRPARHVWEFGRLVVRTPVQVAAVPRTATYHVEEIRPQAGTGWTVTVVGPVEVISDPHEAGHYQRTLTSCSHGPHDTLLRIKPQTVTGFRLARAEA